MSGQQNTEEQTTIGAYLKRLRNEKNISVAEVAAKMYLRLEVIEALEQDDHDNLPGPLYIYGYLQHYARILDVPADELVAMYKKDTAKPREQVAKPRGQAAEPREQVAKPREQVAKPRGQAAEPREQVAKPREQVAKPREQAAEPRGQAAETQKQVTGTLTQPEAKPKQPKSWTYAIIYLVLFILVLASLALWRSRYALEQAEHTGTLDYPITIVEHPDTPFYPPPGTEMDGPGQTPAYPETPEPETTPEAEAAQEPETAPELPPPPGPNDESRATGTQLPETPAETAEGEPEAAPGYKITTITAGAGPDTVTLVLTIDCWIEIFDAENNKVFYDLARVGQTLVLSGTAPFSVLLGNADAATVEFNNTPFDITPHVTGIGIARFVLGEAE